MKGRARAHLGVNMQSYTAETGRRSEGKGKLFSGNGNFFEIYACYLSTGPVDSTRTNTFGMIAGTAAAPPQIIE